MFLARLHAGLRAVPFRVLFAALFLLWLAQPARADQFRIDKVDGEYVIEGHLAVEVPPVVAWRVLTDYDRMALFIPDMSESRVTYRDGLELRVLQKGVTRLGPFSFGYDVERSVHLEPEVSIRSLGLKGNMKKLEMETRLEPSPTGVLVHYRAVMVPDFWVPPILGPKAMRAQVQRQFEALVAEMKRRAAGGN